MSLQYQTNYPSLWRFNLAWAIWFWLHTCNCSFGLYVPEWSTKFLNEHATMKNVRQPWLTTISLNIFSLFLGFRWFNRAEISWLAGKRFPQLFDALSPPPTVITQCCRCTINWNENKNVCVEVVKKKQKNQKTGTTRVVTKTVPADSFFNFFSPPEGSVTALRPPCGQMRWSEGSVVRIGNSCAAICGFESQ